MTLSKKYRKVLKALQRGKSRDEVARKHQVDRGQVDRIAVDHGIENGKGGDG